jgi:recombination protein RecA
MVVVLHFAYPKRGAVFEISKATRKEVTLANKSRMQLLEERLASSREQTPSSIERAQRLEREVEASSDRLYDGMRAEDGNGPGEALRPKEVRPDIVTRTGVMGIDVALGGGLNSGATELYGEESTGKTGLLGTIMAEAQQSELAVALCPTEYLDKKYLADTGVELEALALIKGRTTKMLDLAYRFVTQGPGYVLAFDSATGLRPKKDMDWWAMMHDFLDATLTDMSPGSCLVMVNQVRARKSMDPRKMFAGGTSSAAVKLADMFTTRLELTRENVSDEHYDLNVHVVSSVLRAPASYVRVPVTKGTGVDVWIDLVRAAAEVGVVEKRGNWYYYLGQRLGNGEWQAGQTLQITALGSKVKQETLRVLTCS